MKHSHRSRHQGSVRGRSLMVPKPLKVVAPPSPNPPSSVSTAVPAQGSAGPAQVWPLQSQCMQFYGNPYQAGWLAANTVEVPCPWPLKIGNSPLGQILIHKKCAASLKRVLGNIWDAVNHDITQIQHLRYDVYDGSYNLRPMRGGTAPSMHSFACAIDWDAADNAFHSVKHLFTDQSLLVTKFKEEGWIWGGDWTPGSQDAMHVQAARVHA